MLVEIVFDWERGALDMSAHEAHPAFPWKTPCALHGTKPVNVIPYVTENVQSWGQTRRWANRLHANEDGDGITGNSLRTIFPTNQRG